MLASLASSVNVPMHAGDPDNRTASSATFAREDRTTTPAPLCTFEAEIPSQCECVAALRLSDAVGSVGAGAMIGAVVFVYGTARAALALPRVPPRANVHAHSRVHSPDARRGEDPGDSRGG